MQEANKSFKVCGLPSHKDNSCAEGQFIEKSISVEVEKQQLDRFWGGGDARAGFPFHVPISAALYRQELPNRL